MRTPILRNLSLFYLGEVSGRKVISPAQNFTKQSEIYRDKQPLIFGTAAITSTQVGPRKYSLPIVLDESNGICRIPVSRTTTCGILSSNVWRGVKVSAKAKLNKTINFVLTWPPVYTPLHFDISHVVFVCSMSYLFCAHAANDSFAVCMMI